jgi:hypothetical protein
VPETCEYCGEELDDLDETPNLRVEELHQNQGWMKHFCCPDHLLAWIHADPNELQPHLRG